MKIVFLTVGSVKRPYFKEAVELYTKRIGRYTGFESIEVKDARARLPREVMGREADAIVKKLKVSDMVIALSEEGKLLDSKALAARVEGAMTGAVKRLVFIVGGSYGLDGSVKDRAGLVWSLTPMTLPHELARVVLAEQVYRALTIIRGEPYSH